MDKIIVYVNDAEYAQHQLAPMKNQAAEVSSTHWVVVACPPHFSSHVNKWVSHDDAAAWQQTWSDELFAKIVPSLQSRGDQVTPVVAHGALVDLTQKLQSEHGAAHVMDARHHKFGQDLEPITVDQPEERESRWAVPAAVAGLGAALILANELSQ